MSFLNINGARFVSALYRSNIDICDQNQEGNPVVTKNTTKPELPNVWVNLATEVMEMNQIFEGFKEFQPFPAEAKEKVISKYAAKLEARYEGKKLSALVGWGEKTSVRHRAYCATHNISWLLTAGSPVPNMIKLDTDISDLLDMIRAEVDKAKALKKAEANNPRVIITEWVLEDVNGYVKATYPWPEIHPYFKVKPGVKQISVEVIYEKGHSSFGHNVTVTTHPVSGIKVKKTNVPPPPLFPNGLRFRISVDQQAVPGKYDLIFKDKDKLLAIWQNAFVILPRTKE